MRDRFPISFQIHGTTFDASKTEKGLVVVARAVRLWSALLRL